MWQYSTDNSHQFLLLTVVNIKFYAENLWNKLQDMHYACTVRLKVLAIFTKSENITSLFTILVVSFNYGNVTVYSATCKTNTHIQLFILANCLQVIFFSSFVLQDVSFLRYIACTCECSITLYGIGVYHLISKWSYPSHNTANNI